jgi:F-type H+-transporting ATPase subunit a
MIAGHIVILAFLALIFLFGKLWVAPLSVAAALGINLLELFVVVSAGLYFYVAVRNFRWFGCSFSLTR